MFFEQDVILQLELVLLLQTREAVDVTRVVAINIDASHGLDHLLRFN